MCQSLCSLAGIKPRLDIETGREEPWELKDLRKTCATYHDEHVPESSAEILGYSIGSPGGLTPLSGSPYAGLSMPGYSPWDLELTPDGTDDRVFQFSPDPAKNRDILTSLPGMYWYFPVTRAKPGATVLAQHGDQRMRNNFGRHVLMAMQRYGPGRTVFIGFDSAIDPCARCDVIPSSIVFTFTGAIPNITSRQACEIMAQGQGDACTKDDDCSANPAFKSCQLDGDSGYCTNDGCATSDDCVGGYACNTTASPTFCERWHAPSDITAGRP